MTEKEALLKLAEMYRSDKPFMHGRRNETLMAISALKKEIPKKPVGDLDSVPHYRCPTCFSSVVMYEGDRKYPHCQWCGQALEWSECE